MSIPSIPSAGNLVSSLNSSVKIIQADIYDFNWFLKNSELQNITKISDIEVRKAAEITSKVKEQAFNARKAAEAAKETTDAVKSGNLKGMGKTGSMISSIANVISLVAAIVGAALGVFNTLTINEILNGQTQQFAAQVGEGNRLFRVLGKSVARIANLEKKTKLLENDQRTIGLRGQQAFTNSVRARELAEQSRKLGNDALYEARQGRKILDGQIQKLAAETGLKIAGLKQQYDAIVKQVGTNANNSIQQTIKQLQDAQQQVTKTVNDSLMKSQDSIKKLTADVQKGNTAITALRNGLQQTFNTTQGTIKQVVDKGITPIARASTAWGVTVTPATVTPATVTISDGSAVTVTPAVVTPATVTPAQFSSSAIGQQVAQQIKQGDSTLASADVNLAQGIANVNADLQNTKKTLGKTNINTIDQGARLIIEQLKTQNQQQDIKIKQLEAENQKQDIKINQQDIMGGQGINLLNGIVAALGALSSKVTQVQQNTSAIVPAINQLPQKTADVIVPEIVPNTENAICESLRNGCMQQYIPQLFPKPITPNDISDALARALDAANLAANFPPLSGAIDVHDCVSESTISLPYGGVGLYGLQSQIEQVSNQIEIISKTICRDKTLGANTLNELRSIGGSILYAVEQVASLTGSGFNAMQDDGLLSENNWNYTPGTINLKSGIYNALNDKGTFKDPQQLETEKPKSGVDTVSEIKSNFNSASETLKTDIDKAKEERDKEIEEIKVKEFDYGDLL
jgi:hypothetical protein